MRKTTMYFRPQDDEKMEEIKKALQTDDQTVAVRFALHNCPVPKPRKK